MRRSARAAIRDGLLRLFFHERLETLFDYLPEASVMLDDQVTPMWLARWETIDDSYDARHEAMGAKGRIDTVYKLVPPGELYLDDAAWEAAVAGHRQPPLAQSPGPGVLDAGARAGRNFCARAAAGKDQPFRGIGGSCSCFFNGMCRRCWPAGPKARASG